jgi:hypothetical protein
MPADELTVLGQIVDQIKGLREDFRIAMDRADARHEQNEQWHTEASQRILALEGENNHRAKSDELREGRNRIAIQIIAALFAGWVTAGGAGIATLWMQVHDHDVILKGREKP